jgi:DNA-directed RNA polymerase specialized sigma24 family protein
MQLARAAAKTANRFLAARGVPKSDRDDVIAAAMLWCWENRDNYSLTTTLETWFMNAVRNAYQDLRRGELPISDESIERFGGNDETYDSAAAESSATVLVNSLPPQYKKVLKMIMQGYTREEMIAKGVSKRTIDESRQRIEQLRRLLPDGANRRIYVDRWVTAPTPTSDHADDKLSDIDVALERLDFAPPAGKDCPPCWRCQWYYGFLPSGKRDTRMDIEDAEVREAVRNTEARKIEIAQQVRVGL